MAATRPIVAWIAIYAAKHNEYPNSPLVSNVPSTTTVRVQLDGRSYDIAIASDALPSAAHYIEAWMGQLSVVSRQSSVGSESPAQDTRLTIDNERLTTDNPQRTTDHGQSSTSPKKALVVTDRHVVRPHATAVCRSLSDAGWFCGLYELEPGEQSKRLDVVAAIYDQLVELQADRQTVVVAVGGGVVGDAAGFAAATYARGVPFVQVPTSLLAHVDSSVGGKVGVNHPRAKNLIGAFYQPVGVLIDTATLDTLPSREYHSGLAEVVKYGVILDREFFEFLEAHTDEINRRAPEVLRYIIARCCRLKADIVEQDEYERTGLRAVLNYGHTFGHAFEALYGYGELLHGEAVAIGMICASRLAERRGLVDASVTERQIRLLESLRLPTQLPQPIAFSIDDVLQRMQLDKKTAAGRLRFILPTELGHVELFSEVPRDDVRAVLAQTMSSMKP